MLLPVAVNTIVIPKERWYPDPDYNAKLVESASIREIRTIQHPKTTLQHIDWDNFLHVGRTTGDPQDEQATYWLNALSASSAVEGLSQIVPTIRNE